MANENGILDDFVSTLACASEDHYPMSIRREESEHGVAIYGIVRTVSGDLDGCGGRTDLHDMLAALWAVVLRANGVASSRLVDVEGWGGSPELSARWLIFDQPSEECSRKTHTMGTTSGSSHTLLGPSTGFRMPSGWSDRTCADRRGRTIVRRPGCRQFERIWTLVARNCMLLGRTQTGDTIRLRRTLFPSSNSIRRGAGIAIGDDGIQTEGDSVGRKLRIAGGEFG